MQHKFIELIANHDATTIYTCQLTFWRPDCPPGTPLEQFVPFRSSRLKPRSVPADRPKDPGPGSTAGTGPFLAGPFCLGLGPFVDLVFFKCLGSVDPKHVHLWYSE